MKLFDRLSERWSLLLRVKYGNLRVPWFSVGTEFVCLCDGTVREGRLVCRLCV